MLKPVVAQGHERAPVNAIRREVVGSMPTRGEELLNTFNFSLYNETKRGVYSATLHVMPSEFIGIWGIKTLVLIETDHSTRNVFRIRQKGS